MWLHICIFALLGFVLTGWRFGWIPKDELSDSKGRRIFLALAAAGNLLGMILSVQDLNRQIPADYRMEKKEDPYEEELMVSINGEPYRKVSVQVPEIPGEETDEEPEEISEEELQKRALLEILEQFNAGKGDEEYYYLPAEYEGNSFSWERPRDTSGSLLAALFLVAAAASLVLKGRERQAALEKRREDLVRDYPELIMKFTLLIEAGMTVRNTFMKLAQDYERRKGDHPRWAYEEIQAACHEMDGGISESEAYYRFGERCAQVKYKTFATLLIQNLQKGSRQLAELLEKESGEAWDERKRKARVLGEAAATRLLFPMILMMVCVMAIVMVPAVLSFYA